MRKLQLTNINSPEIFEREYFKRFKKGSKGVTGIDRERQGLMTRYFHEGKLLDLGAGDSDITISLAERENTDIYVLDWASRIIENLRTKYPKITYVVGDCANTPFKDDFFDYIIAGELLEHLNNPRTMVQEVMRILKSGGVFSLSTPYKESLTHDGLISAKHIWSFDEQDVKDLLEPYGDVRTFVYEGERHPRTIAYLVKK